jgi:hypothetical protein
MNELAGTGVGSRARRQDVVDQNDCRPFEEAYRPERARQQLDRKWLTLAKCVRHVVRSTPSGQCGLRRTAAPPSQQTPDWFAQTSCEIVRLIEAAHEESVPVQRHRHDRIRIPEHVRP